MVERDMEVARGSYWIIDIGPSAGNEGGLVVAQEVPAETVKSRASRAAPFLAHHVKSNRHARLV